MEFACQGLSLLMFYFLSDSPHRLCSTDKLTFVSVQKGILCSCGFGRFVVFLMFLRVFRVFFPIIPTTHEFNISLSLHFFPDGHQSFDLFEIKTLKFFKCKFDFKSKLKCVFVQILCYFFLKLSVLEKHKPSFTRLSPSVRIQNLLWPIKANSS